MTIGIVSQIGRLLPSPQFGFSIPDAIQTDAQSILVILADHC
jgi:hypothetical protein